MKIIKNKKAVEEAIGGVSWEIITFIILAALIIFAFFWYSGLGKKIIALFKSF